MSRDEGTQDNTFLPFSSDIVEGTGASGVQFIFAAAVSSGIAPLIKISTNLRAPTARRQSLLLP